MFIDAVAVGMSITEIKDDTVYGGLTYHVLLTLFGEDDRQISIPLHHHYLSPEFAIEETVGYINDMLPWVDIFDDVPLDRWDEEAEALQEIELLSIDAIMNEDDDDQDNQ